MVYKTLHDRISEINPLKARLILIANALLVVVCSILAIYCAINIYDDPYHDSFDNFNHTVEAWSSRFGALALFFALLLRNLQGKAYWPTWAQFKSPVLDERQKKARSRAYENAYPIAILGLFIGSISLFTGQINRYTDHARGDITDITLFVGLIFYLALPSVLATFQVDS